MMFFDKSEIAAMCRTYGGLLHVPAGLDGARLMWAISGNESSFGKNCTPRHEPGYCTGRYSKNAQMIELTRMFGCDAHKSYGPWQVMFVNCLGYKPEEFRQLDACAHAFLGYFNRTVDHQKPQTIEQIGDMFNSGNFKDKIVPAKYIADLKAHYAIPLPTEAV